MPCNTVVLNTVELDKIPNRELLLAALRATYGAQSVFDFSDAIQVHKVSRGERFRISGGTVTGTASVERLQEITGEIKRAYSRAVVELAAKRFGWTIQKSSDPRKFQIVKR